MKISASKIKSWNLCPKMLWYRYILRIPTPDKEVFRIWRETETIYCDIISKKRKPIKEPQSEVEKLAMALYNNKELSELVMWQKLKFQKKYDVWDFIAYTDIETPTVCIDLKTSSTNWTKKTVSEYRFQAKIYKLLNWKEFYFAVVNKKTYEVQVIKVNIFDYDDLKAKVEEVKLGFNMMAFPAKPWFHCERFCDYHKICNKKSVAWRTRKG